MAKKSWRPDDWGKLDKTFWMDSSCKAYEKGADSMLEALKARGKRLEGCTVQTPIGGMAIGQVDIVTILDTKLSKGWLVFIPEE